MTAVRLGVQRIEEHKQEMEHERLKQLARSSWEYRFDNRAGLVRW